MSKLKNLAAVPQKLGQAGCTLRTDLEPGVETAGGDGLVWGAEDWKHSVVAEHRRQDVLLLEEWGALSQAETTRVGRGVTQRALWTGVDEMMSKVCS